MYLKTIMYIHLKILTLQVAIKLSFYYILEKWITGTWFPVGFYAGSRIFIWITVLFENETGAYTQA